MKFRPCIDLHQGKVKQIVGSSLNLSADEKTVTNYQSERPSSWFAELYRKDGLDGGHVIRLGPGNDEAACSSLRAWPGGLQIGGGIDLSNALYWLDQGASHVIVTSYVFKDGQVHFDRLKELSAKLGKKRLVLDLSCKKVGGSYYVVTDYWQKTTQVELNHENLDLLAGYCDEFLVHAVDFEGKQSGVSDELLVLMGDWAKIPIVYAGGIHSYQDIAKIKKLGGGRVDFTVGSALDLFGGNKIAYQDLIGMQKNGFAQVETVGPTD